MWIKMIWLLCLLLALPMAKSSQNCSFPTYHATNTSSIIRSGVNSIMYSCEVEINKKERQINILAIEISSIETEQEKYAKEKQEKDKLCEDLRKTVKELSKQELKVSKEIGVTNQQIRNINSQIQSKEIEINKTQASISNLKGMVQQTRSTIESLKRRINKEQGKRECGFGRRRRRGLRFRRFRRSFRRFRIRVPISIGIGGRRPSYRVGGIGWGKKDATRANLVACKINNYVSRLMRTKEKAERDESRINKLLSNAQNVTRRKEAGKSKLIVIKNSLDKNMQQLKQSLALLTKSLLGKNVELTKTNNEISATVQLINDLSVSLERKDIELEDAEVKKNEIVKILTWLRSVWKYKVADLKDVDSNGVLQKSFLEEIAEINKQINIALDKLRKLACV